MLTQKVVAVAYERWSDMKVPLYNWTSIKRPVILITGHFRVLKRPEIIVEKNGNLNLY